MCKFQFGWRKVRKGYLAYGRLSSKFSTRGIIEGSGGGVIWKWKRDEISKSRSILINEFEARLV